MKNSSQEKSPRLVTPEGFCKTAERYYRNGNYTAAQRYWEMALEIDDRCAEAHYGLGRIAYDQSFKRSELSFSETDLALAHLQRAAELELHREHLYLLLSQLYQRVAHKSEGVPEDELEVTILKKGVERFPESAILFVELARVQNARLRFNDAVAAARRAVELEPRNTYAWEELAFGLAMQRNFYPAHDAATQAVKLDPENIRAMNYQNMAATNLAYLHRRN